MRACVWALTAALVALSAAAIRPRSDQDFEFDDDKETFPAAAASELAGAPGAARSRPRRPRSPRRYLYDPNSPLCRALVCKKREVCLVRDAARLAPDQLTPTVPLVPPRALCAYKKDILRRGDIIVAATSDEWDDVPAERDDDEDVFYESGEGGEVGEVGEVGEGGEGEDGDEGGEVRERGGGGRGRGAVGAHCVGCPARGHGRGQFLCGSDNRTYSSLCRLDLHNCVRRGAGAGVGGSPVRLACRGFCPCAGPHDPIPPAPPAPAASRRLHHRPRGHARRYYDDDWRRRKSESSHNEVLPERTTPTRRRLSQSQGSEGCALDKMANRLLDWFSVVMEEAGGRPPGDDERGGATGGFPPGCKPEVRWMFAHLDVDADGMLSADNLYALRHDERERCLRPFLASCGASEAGEGGVSRAAWCACLRRAARPCTALARAHAVAGGGGVAAGAYVPACDSRGYYRPRQCHAALAVCWCVDLHGVEVAGSRTKGAPACDQPGGAPADDEDGALGSGDAELRF